MDVFDLTLRWLGVLDTGEKGASAGTPRLSPVENGLLVQSGERTSFFSAGPGTNALRAELQTPALSSRVIEHVRRLGGTLPTRPMARSVEAKGGAVQLSTALSTFLAIQWPLNPTEEVTPHASEVTWKDGALLDPTFVEDFDGPLVVIAHAYRRGTAYKVVLADDWSEDPIVFETYRERGPLSHGVRLSALLARMKPGKEGGALANPPPAPPPAAASDAIPPYLREAMRAQGADLPGPLTAEIFRARLPWDQEMIRFCVVALQKDPRYAKTAFNSVLASGTPFLDAAAELLKSPHEEVRYLAANHYGLLVTKAPEQRAALQQRASDLYPALEDASPRVIAAAAWSLGKIGATASAELLRPLAKDDRRVVATAAATALKQL